METRRILVVDDYRDAAESLAELLRFDGHEVRVAYDGITALDIAEQFRPGIWLLDLAMPNMDGYTVARRIREKPWGKDAVLIALTGWGQQEMRERCDQAGIDAHFLKPVDYVELSKLIASLERKRSPNGEKAANGESA